jgi:hypothetical protein
MGFQNYKIIPRKSHPKYYPEVISSEEKESEKIIFKKSKNNHFIQEVHDKHVMQMANKPPLIGIYGDYFSETEVSLFNQKERVGEVDLVIKVPQQGVVYYIEYKCRGLESNKNKAGDQLKKAQKFIADKYRGKLEKLLYVHDDFVVEELINDEWIPFNYTPVK